MKQMNMEMPGRRKKGRPKKRLMDAVKEDMERVGVTEDNSVESIRWRQMTPRKSSKRKNKQKKTVPKLFC